MSTLKVSNVQHGSAASAAITLDANGQATLNGLAYPTSGSLSGRNRIINGDMRIDQRNAGASVSTSGSFPVDRFSVINTGSSTFTATRGTGGPAGYTNFLSYTVSTGAATGAGDQVFFRQIVEGVNGADLGWGSASAQSVTIGFWVRSSLTGTFGLAVQNYSANRSYVASYSVGSANTWEYKTVTIVGDTSGTWNTDTANGWASIIWDLGTGTTASSSAGSWAAGSFRGLTSGVKVASTSGATFYITGVQLEAGSVATPFERRSYGQELALCQRYCNVVGGDHINQVFALGMNVGTLQGNHQYFHPVKMRGAPTLTVSAPGDLQISTGTTAYICTAVAAAGAQSSVCSIVVGTVASGLTAGQATRLEALSLNARMIWSVEL